MFTLRTVARTQARSLRVAPAMSVRGYADGAAAGGGDSFNKKEQAEEAVYVKKQEALKLAKLREQLAKTEEDKAALQKQVADLEANSV